MVLRQKFLLDTLWVQFQNQGDSFGRHNQGISATSDRHSLAAEFQSYFYLSVITAIAQTAQRSLLMGIRIFTGATCKDRNVQYPTN